MEECRRTKNKAMGISLGYLLSALAGIILFAAIFMHQIPPVGAVSSIKVPAQDIKDYLEVLDEKDFDSEIELDNVLDKGDKVVLVSQPPLTVRWGMADTVATVGKLFEYTLPKDAFQGDVTNYEVREMGKDVLPSWLHFDSLTNTLQGIPALSHIGSQYLLEVTAVSKLSNDTQSQAKDLFTLNVADEQTPVRQTTAIPLKEANKKGMKPIVCPQGSPVTMVTVIIDTDLDVLHAKEKVDMARGMCNHLQIPSELLKVMPVGNKPLFDSSALVAGPGDVKTPQHSGTMLQWSVGCGNVNANHMPILQEVETTSNNGGMTKAIGHGVIGWHVTNNHPHAQRMKRQADYFTQTIGVSEGPPTRQPVPTMVIDERDHELTRSIPMMASPSYGGISPTKSRHHHRGSKSKGRHHGHKTRTHIHHSPTQKPSHKTKFTRTVMATQTVMPIQPTRIIDMVPSVIDTDYQRPRPSYEHSSPIAGETYTHIQPSETVPAHSSTSKETQPLPTRPSHGRPTETINEVRPTKPTTEATREPPVVKPTHYPPQKPTKPIEPSQPNEPYNFAPQLQAPIDRLMVRVNSMFQYKVPKETFYDPEDGNTENLRLVLTSGQGLSLQQTSWLKFNQRTQELYGMPLRKDVKTEQYTLAAIDTSGKIAKDRFEIIITDAQVPPINHEITMKLGFEFFKFTWSLEYRLDVLQGILKLYGDDNLDNILVTDIREGSVLFSWTNTSLRYNPCPIGELESILSKLRSDDGHPSEDLKEVMHPFKVIDVDVELLGPCHELITLPPHSEADGMTRETSDEDILITTVIPAVVIGAILLLAGCIACVLYRKRRKDKLSDDDQHTFVNKGIPIIFHDEMDDKPDPPTKPLILDEEKPPLSAPPGYQRSVQATPQSTHKYFGDEYETEDMTSPLYQPPPPFAGSGSSRDYSRQSRPRMQAPQHYRHPPPYVPP